MAENEPDGLHWRLSDLLGPAADQAARAIEATARQLFRGYWYRRSRFVSLSEDDLMQQAMIALVQKAERIQGGQEDEPANLDAYLNRTVVTAGLKLIRDRKPMVSADEPEFPEIAELAPVDPDLVLSIRATLRRVQSQMEPECITLLRRRLVEEEPRESLARWLGLNTNAVGVRIHRCLSRLRELVRGLGSSGMTFLEAH